jgi:hypothetical protein
MRIMMVGALSWNPERVRSLHEAGHRLWGVWTRSMAWDEGPYQMLEDCVRTVAAEDAARTVATNEIECVYGLFQVYGREHWGPPVAGVEHDVWTVLRSLIGARARGEFDAPIVFHFGFDVHNFDDDVVRSLDGQLVCNREQLTYWTSSPDDGGAGLDLFDDCPVVDFLDGDRPKREFMTDDFAPRLSERTGRIETVCVGRPFNIDYVALARSGINLHLYGNGFDDPAEQVAADLLRRRQGLDADLVRSRLHFHPSLQPSGRSWPEVRAWKSAWVREFSQYDAGWSYVGTPYKWPPLQDAAAIPNRLSTYVLAGLPVISDVQPGRYRDDELVRLEVNVDLEGGDYERLRETLEAEARSGERRRNARAARDGYSFDASIEPLLDFVGRARDRYFDLTPSERRRPVPERPESSGLSVGAGTADDRRGLVSRARSAPARRLATARQRRIVRQLRR